MYTLIITGGIGSGKTLACSYLQSRGAEVLSLDDITHALLAGCDPMRAELRRAFGDAIFDEEGSVITSELAKRAFANGSNTALLNSITFPYIKAAAAERAIEAKDRERHQPQLLVIEVPLLTEAPEFAELADEVMAISAPEDVRLRRAVARGGNPDDMAARMAQQASDAEREALADTVVVNDGEQADFIHDLERWWEYRAQTGWKAVRHG